MSEFNHNKLLDLEIARMFYLKTPNTYILNSTIDLEELFISFPSSKFLTKALWNHNLFNLNEGSFIGGSPKIIEPTVLEKIETNTKN